MKRHALLLLAALAATACTFEDGRGWATVDFSLGAELVVDEDHASDEATLVTDRGLLVTLTTLDLDAATLSLLETGGSASGEVRFDPANPPEGYTLCHAGHCHREDGALVDYEDIEAELAAADGATVLTAAEQFSVTAVVDGLAASAVELGKHDSATVDTAAVSVNFAAVSMAGRVEIDDEVVDFVLTLSPENGLTLQAEADETIGRGGLRAPLVDLWLSVEADLFDGIAFDNLERTDGVIRIEPSSNHAVLQTIAARLAAATLDAYITE